jgi:putative transposase
MAVVTIVVKAVHAWSRKSYARGEGQRILLTCNQLEYASLPLGQILPALTDQGLYNSCEEDCIFCSEGSFYSLLHAHGQVQRCGRARPPQEPKPVPRLRAAEANQVWSWDITYLPTTVREIWLYLHLAIDVSSRKVVDWDVEEHEDPNITGDLVNRARLRKRISKGRKQPLILHADNGNAMHAARLAGWQWASPGFQDKSIGVTP